MQPLAKSTVKSNITHYIRGWSFSTSYRDNIKTDLNQMNDNLNEKIIQNALIIRKVCPCKNLLRRPYISKSFQNYIHTWHFPKVIVRGVKGRSWGRCRRRVWGLGRGVIFWGGSGDPGSIRQTWLKLLRESGESGTRVQNIWVFSPLVPSKWEKNIFSFAELVTSVPLKKIVTCICF